ncbi:MAG: transglycosylase domain-containing protein [Vicinamibacteria bacterium]|nr:transglycosylase domain-containing protein [Vicinamibacteria bacterium]
MQSRFAPKHRLLLLLVALGMASLLTLVAILLRPILEKALHARLIVMATNHGALAQIDELRIRIPLGLRISGILIEHPGVRVQVEDVDFSLAPWGSGWVGPLVRLHTGEIAALLPARSRLRLAPMAWDVRVGLHAIRARLRQKGERLDIEWQDGESFRLRFRAFQLRAARLVSARFRETIELHPGVVDGTALLERKGFDALRLVLESRMRQAALSGLTNQTQGDDEESSGVPTDVDLRLAAVWRRAANEAIIERIHFSAAGMTLVGRARIQNTTRNPHVDLDLDVERVDFSRLLAAAGLELPIKASGLGAASLGARVVGRLSNPRSLRVEQRLDFTPPPEPIPALVRLRGPFTHHVITKGRRRKIDVSPESIDFIPFDEVPPLFIRALLLAEDTNFHGHSGIDLSEVPVALATNWKRGTTARGASTITQQLAKNLFLTREKRFSRKIQELAIALLIDSTLSKRRILEIYLNVIEWGPGIHGLRPASLHYFGTQPQDLTPKQTAFLVTLIPGPIKYQRSIRDGAPSPAFESMMIGLLNKLRAVEALTEDEYQDALFEPILIAR